MKKFVTCVFLFLSLQLSLCLNLQKSNPASNNPQNPKIMNSSDAKANEQKAEPENLNKLCKDLKDAENLNENLLSKVKKIEKLMEDHSKNTIIRKNNLNVIDNSHSHSHVHVDLNNNSYKKFLKDISQSYQNGYYHDKISKLKQALSENTLPNLKAKCENYSSSKENVENSKEKSVTFIQKNMKKLNKNFKLNMKKEKLMSLNELHTVYSQLLEKSKKLLLL
jgi:hypothetical protein